MEWIFKICLKLQVFANEVLNSLFLNKSKIFLVGYVTVSHFLGLSLNHIVVHDMAKDQVLSGWTMLTVWDLRHELRIVPMVDGVLTTVVMKRIYPSAVSRVRNHSYWFHRFLIMGTNMHLSYLLSMMHKLDQIWIGSKTNSMN